MTVTLVTIQVLFLLYLSSFIPWTLIIFLIFFITNLAQKKAIKSLNWKKALIISSIISLIASIVPGVREINDISSRAKGRISKINTKIYTEDDKKMMKEIIQNALSSNSDSLSIHKKDLWAILENYGTLSVNEIESLKEVTTSVFTSYMKLFYEDALASFKNGETIRSQKRAEYEDNALIKGIFDEKRIKDNSELIRKIANHHPVLINGDEYVLDEAGINSILSSIDERSKIVEWLFTKE